MLALDISIKSFKTLGFKGTTYVPSLPSLQKN